MKIKGKKWKFKDKIYAEEKRSTTKRLIGGMLDVTANSLTDKLEKEGAIAAERRAVYIYGFELVISTVSGMAAVFLIAALGFHRPLEGIIFLVATILLRIYSGGYHADTYLRCFITTLLSFTVAMILYEVLLHFKVNAWIVIGIAIMAGLYIWEKTPVTHPNQPLSEKRIKECRKKGRGILVIEVGISCILTGLQYSCGIMIMLSILEVAVFMAIVKDKKK